MNEEITNAPIARIENKIFFIRDERVMIDSNLAEMYAVETKALNRAVKRNSERFPADFMFQLTSEEVATLRCQIGTSKSGRGGRRYLPNVFTEQGVAMLSSILKSKRAIHVNIEIMRAFVRLRQMLASNDDLARKLKKLENNYNRQFRVVFDAIRQLMASPPSKSKPIGFRPKALKK